MPTVQLSKLGSEVSRIVRSRLAGARLDQILVGQAKRRMAAGGDSEHKYPELWKPKEAESYRSGGQPLLDKGMLRNSLSGFSIETSEGIRSWLIGPLIAIYHQSGFSTEGPNFIPLTLKAKRAYEGGGMDRVKELTFKPPKKKAGSTDPTKRRLVAPKGFKTVLALALVRGDKMQDGRTVKSVTDIGRGRVRVKFNKRKKDKKATETNMRRKAQVLLKDKSKSGESFSNELVLGTDYIMAWNGVTVPQRKIFNLPPEDVEEIAESIRFALR